MSVLIKSKVHQVYYKTSSSFTEYCILDHPEVTELS